MKLCRTVAFLLFTARVVHGQGTINFVNRITGTVDAPVFDTDGRTGLAGTAYLAQLYAGPTAGAIEAVGRSVTFRTGSAAGYFDTSVNSTREIPGVSVGGLAYVQVRAWEAAMGSTFEAAVAAGGRHGSTPVFSVLTGGGLIPPKPLVGLTSFSLTLDTGPVIRTQPASVAVGLGDTARFEVVASGVAPLLYQWKKSGVGIPDATQSIVEIHGVVPSDAASYSVRVSNSQGSVESAPAQLTILPLPVVAQVLIDPARPVAGGPVRLEVIVNGVGPFTYQWRRNDANISGASSSVFSRTSVDAGTYSVRVTGPGGAVVREVLRIAEEYPLTLTAGEGGRIVADPSAATHPGGTWVTLTATPDPGYVFQGWAGDIAGTENPTTLLVNAATEVLGIFRPVGGTIYFTNLGGGVDAPIYGADGATPLQGDACVAQLYAGTSAARLAAVGSPLPFLTGDGAGYFHGEIRVVPGVAPGSAVFVQVRAWKVSEGDTYETAAAKGSAHGTSAILTVVTGNAGLPPTLPTPLAGLTSFRLGATAPLITRMDGPEAISVGERATLTVEATGSVPLRYQWFLGKDGDTSHPVGSNAVQYVSEPLKANASFWVQVDNDAGRMASAVHTIIVTRQPQEIAFTPPSPVRFGTPPIRLVATASSGLPVSWTLISGPAALDGDILTPTATGTVVVRAIQPGNDAYDAAAVVERSLAIEPGLATVTISDLEQPFDGSPRQPSVLVNPPGLAMRVTFDGAATLPASLGTYAVEAVVTDPNYTGLGTATFKIVAVRSVTGWVFLDINGDGSRGAGEAGIPGVPVHLLETGAGDELGSAVSDADGAFSFSGLATGRYCVLADNPPGHVSTTPELRLVPVVAGRPPEIVFGKQPVGTVTGVVFEDVDGDGHQQTGESGLGGVSLRLSGANLERTATSAPDGTFQFENVEPGRYTLQEIDPDGFGSTTPNLRTLSVTTGGAASSSFGDQAAGSIAGAVFADTNGDGLREEGEAGLAGVNIRLSGGNLSRSTTTSEDGTYQFPDLPPGNYRVEETDPTGFVSTTPNARAVALRTGGAAAAAFADQPVQSISGMVYEDQNGNSRFDWGEPGIAHVTVRLLQAVDETQVLETVTSEDGVFQFADVPAGDYIVRQSIPDAYTLVTTTGVARTASLHAAAISPDFNQKSVSLAEDQAAAVNFANHVAGQLSGTVFNDLDGDSQPSLGESGLGGIRVAVRNADTGAALAWVVTSGDGMFLVPGLPAGTYEVVQETVAGYLAVRPSSLVTLPEGGAGTANFPNRAAGTVSGLVYNDEDGDGVHDAAEPGIGGVQVNLQGVGASATATTAGDGTFLFTSTPAGDITIEQTALTGYRFTTASFVRMTLSSNEAGSTSFANQSLSLAMPMIVTEPGDLTLAEGASGMLGVVAEGSAPLAFQWYKDGSPIAVATNASLAFSEASLVDSGLYEVRVHNSLGDALSRQARVSITPPDPFEDWVLEQVIPAGLRGAQDDPDGDGLCNLLEFVVGTSPMKADASAIPAAVVLNSGGDRHLAFEFHRNPAAAAAQVFLETSDDVVHWARIPSATPEVILAGPEGDRVRLTDPVGLSERPARFLRLGVESAGATGAEGRLTVPSGPHTAAEFQFDLSGETGGSYAIEWSMDLRSWNLLTTVVAASTPTTLAEPSGTSAPHRFYRARPL